MLYIADNDGDGLVGREFSLTTMTMTIWGVSQPSVVIGFLVQSADMIYTV